MFRKKVLSFEELKEQADKLGYRLVKKDKHVSFIPCVCGHNKRSQEERYIDHGKKEIIFVCKKCGLTVSGPTEKQARINWNETVRKIQEESNVK